MAYLRGQVPEDDFFADIIQRQVFCFFLNLREELGRAAPVSADAVEEGCCFLLTCWAVFLSEILEELIPSLSCLRSEKEFV